MDETDRQGTAATTLARSPAGAGRTRRRFDEAFRRLSVETWQVSGLSAADFCRREGLNAKSFARWISQIVGDDAASDPPPQPPTFVPVVVTSATPAVAGPDPSSAQGHAKAAIEIVLHGGRHLRVSAGNFDELALRRLVRVLESIGDPDRETLRC